MSKSKLCKPFYDHMRKNNFFSSKTLCAGCKPKQTSLSTIIKRNEMILKHSQLFIKKTTNKISSRWSTHINLDLLDKFSAKMVHSSHLNSIAKKPVKLIVTLRGTSYFLKIMLQTQDKKISYPDPYQCPAKQHLLLPNNFPHVKNRNYIPPPTFRHHSHNFRTSMLRNLLSNLIFSLSRSIWSQNSQKNKCLKRWRKIFIN